MRVTLISPYSQIESTGLRILSACLRNAGFETRMVFLPSVNEMVVGTDYGARHLASTTLQKIVDLCADSRLVGIGVMTSSFSLAGQLTQALKETQIPVIWGGVHPTVRPAECLRYADLACIGEGEESIVQLAQRIEAGSDYHDLPNLAYLDSRGQLRTNPLNPLKRELDELPFPDYEYDQHYVLHDGEMLLFTAELMRYHLGDIGSWTQEAAYGILTARGCPYRCSYCVNSALAKLYPDWSSLRRRSPGNVIAEIQAARARLPSIGAIIIRDDTFLANPESHIAEFSRLYKEKVGLPFRAYTTAQTVDPAKLEHLLAAGLCLAIMGIQTGSPRIQKLYNRTASNECMLQAARLLRRYQSHLPRPTYDLITDNPYETKQDRLATLRLIHRLPAPYRLSLYSLTFYPGTELYERAKASGLIQEEEQAIYRRNFQMIEPNFYNLALFCHHLNLPRPLLYLLTRRSVFTLLSWGPLDRACGLLLRLLLVVRLRRNRRLVARRRSEWLHRRREGDRA